MVSVALVRFYSITFIPVLIVEIKFFPVFLLIIVSCFSDFKLMGLFEFINKRLFL